MFALFRVSPGFIMSHHGHHLHHHMADHNYFSGGDSGDSDADFEVDDMDEEVAAAVAAACNNQQGGGGGGNQVQDLAQSRPNLHIVMGTLGYGRL